MGGALLRDLASGDLHSLVLRDGVPIGAARCDQSHPHQPGAPVAGLLRIAGSPQLATRYPVAVAPSALDQLAEHLATAWERKHPLDPLWISVDGIGSDGRATVLVLLTREQSDVARSSLLGLSLADEIRLPNGQIVRPTHPADTDWLSRSNTMECRPIAFTEASPGLMADGESYFQAAPSGEHTRRLAASHSFRCLLHPSLRHRFRSGFASVRNPVLEQTYPGVDLALAVLVRFADKVDGEHVVVDETVSTAIGLRPGEIVEVVPLPKLAPELAKRALSFRHSLCRVYGSNTTDMEKPLIRLPDEVLDIIGVPAGARVVLEHIACRQDQPPTRHKIVVRALPWRGEQWPVPKPGVPDILMETGSQDLPPVTLDLACQKQLDTTRGSVVYVRPAVGSLVVDEWSNAATAVVVAALGAAVLGQVLLTVLFVAAFMALLVLQVWRRLR